MPRVKDLITAAKQGNLDVVDKLLSEHPELSDAKDEDGVSAILLALYHGHPDVARRLARDRNDFTIFEATVLGKLDRLKEIVEAIPESVNAVSPDGFTALGFAAYFGQLDSATFLLAKGANPNIASKNGLKVSPLHSALAGGQSAIALMLINGGSDLNLKNAEGWTPLHYAADVGDAEIASLLVDMGADHTVKNNEGRTAAELAVDVGHDHVADAIFEAVALD